MYQRRLISECITLHELCGKIYIAFNMLRLWSVGNLGWSVITPSRRHTGTVPMTKNSTLLISLAPLDLKCSKKRMPSLNANKPRVD